MNGKAVEPFIVELARQGEDAIFRRETDNALDQMGQDVLCTLGECAEIVNRPEEPENQTPNS